MDIFQLKFQCLKWAHNTCPSSCHSVVIMGEYHDKVKLWVHGWKKNKVRERANHWAQLFHQKYPHVAQDISAIVPMASHQQKIGRRGFSPVGDLAFWLSYYYQIPVIEALTMPRYTRTQAGLSRSDRLKLPANTFELNPVPLPKKVVLVDDILTTGRTLSVAAEQLKKHPIQPEVHAWVLFKAGDR